MNFNSLIGLAKQANREKNSQPVKGFSTTVTPIKKPVRSNVPSSSVQAFLAKREQEARDKVVQARKEKDKLLALRAQNSKSNKAAKLMASRTKDNDFSRIRLTEDEVEARGKVEAELRRKVICDKAERMKARIKLEEHEAQLPHKRKRKPKTHLDMERSPTPPPLPPSPPPRQNCVKKPRPPPPPAMSFTALIQMASAKQLEGPEDEPEPENKNERPMTKAERLEEEYKRYKLNGGTGGRTDFELAYFRMHSSENNRSTKKRIPKKAPASREANFTPEERAPDRPNMQRLSSGESARLQENRNSYRTDDRSAQRAPVSKGVPRPSDSKSAQRFSDSQRTVNKSMQRASDSTNSKRPNENMSSQRTGDTRYPQQSNGNRNPRHNSDNMSSQRTGDTRYPQQSNDNRNPRHNSESMNSQRTADTRYPQQSNDNRNPRQNSENMNSQRTADTRYPQQSNGNRNPRHNSENMNSQRTGDTRYPQQSNDNRNPRQNSENMNSQRTGDGASVKRTSGNKIPQRGSDYNVDQRTQSARDQYRAQERVSREPTPKVPSYTTVKTPNRPHPSDVPNNISQYRTSPVKHESAFLNSLPNKKPRLGFPVKEQTRPPIVSKYDAEIEKQKSIPSKNNVKQSNSRDKKPPEQTQKLQKRDSRDHVKSQDVFAKPGRPVSKPPVDRRPVNPTKVSLNESWLEDDDSSQDPRMLSMPKKRPVLNDREAPSVGQKRPAEQEVRRDRPQGQKVLPNQQQSARKGSSNPNGQYNEKKFKHPDDYDKYRPPEKKIKTSSNDYSQLDDRLDNRPKSKKVSSSPQSAPEKRSSSPTGSRRSLDTMWPMKSMARNPSMKLPPIRSSKCSFIKSDSEEDDEEEEFDEEDEDMADFIDDAPLSDHEDYSRHIREIFGYDKRRYRNETYDDEAMESTFAQQMKEEARSRRIGRMEDLEEEKKELERKKGTEPRPKGKW